MWLRKPKCVHSRLSKEFRFNSKPHPQEPKRYRLRNDFGSNVNFAINLQEA